MRRRLPWAGTTVTGGAVHAVFPSLLNGVPVWSRAACGRRVEPIDLYFRAIRREYRCGRCHQKHP
jgi:hypothetical protein